MPHNNISPKPIKCFVCNEAFEDIDTEYNWQVNLPVCNRCSGSDEERKKVKELLEGLADGFVCGCI